MSHWFHVSYKLPDKYIRVLGIDMDSIYHLVKDVSYDHYHKCWVDNSDFEKKVKITHWTEIPKLPL